MWYALDVVCEAGAAEAVRYGLMEAGAAGVEETATASAGGLIGVVCYFAEMPDRELVRGSLAEALRIYGLDAGAVREAEWREVAEYDWLAAWKASWQPIEVGSRFLIAPPWSGYKHRTER
ncbi:MAG: 50S ribosomal protein L11 methyltransferase [Pyrinomonadaceae bacterium]